MISFDSSGWEYVRQRHEGWWERKNKTPLAGAAVQKEGVRVQTPLTQANCHDLSKKAEDIAREIEVYLASFEYYGDAYPYYNMACFGPGVLAAMLGAELDNSTGRVWFRPVEIKEISEMHFSFDPDNVWFCRIRDLYHACVKRLGGRGIVSMVDLGGILDILSTFRPGELLLYDLYDSPEEVLRLIKEAEAAWYRVYSELAAASECERYGYTDWTSILSSKPSYVTQCDFSYMIGPDMFKTFVHDTLKRDCDRLERVIYHLDGPGQLIHTDSLFGIEKLDCVQWVPGAGNPTCENYPDLYREIVGAGKLINLGSGNYSVIAALCEQTQKPGAISSHQVTTGHGQKQNIIDGLKMLGVVSD